MDPLELAKLQLNSLILGLENNSSIPIQASELKMIMMFIHMAQQGKTV